MKNVKIIRKILSVSAAILLVFSLTACDLLSNISIEEVQIELGNNKNTAVPAIEATPSPTKGPEHKFKRGVINDDVYTNEYLGFSFRLPDTRNFKFYTDGQIAERWKYTGELMKTPEGVYDIMDRKGFTDVGAYAYINYDLNVKMSVTIINNGTESADLLSVMDQIDPNVKDQYGQEHKNTHLYNSDYRTIAGIEMLHRSFGGKIAGERVNKWERDVYLYMVDFYIVEIECSWVAGLNTKSERYFVFEDCFSPVEKI